MTFDFENFDDTNSDIIEIVSSESALKLLKRSGNKNIKVCLPLSLYIGKLDSMKPFNRKVLSKYYKNNATYNFTDVFHKLEQIIQHCTKIRIWSSHLDSDSYCLLLLICYLFQDKKISAIFSEELDGNAPSITSLSELEIHDLEKREHVLTQLQKNDYCEQWEKIVNDNKELRYMMNGVVISCDIDSFNHEIIDRLKEVKKAYIYYFITDLMIHPSIPNVMFPDMFYKYLIENLESDGIIKSSIIDGKKYIELNQ